jgi:hypothetical protein
VRSPSNLDDAIALGELVGRAKAGEADALERLAEALQDDVFRLALRMTAHREDAEDATQEILVKIITKLGGFRGDSSVRTWAYRIAVRHVLDRQITSYAVSADEPWFAIAYYGCDGSQLQPREPCIRTLDRNTGV